MTTPSKLYDQLLKIGTSPAIVYYGTDERIELSGKVTANHIAKISNYLANDVDLIPGSRVVLDLPVHWKTVVWAIGAMMAGGNVVVGRNRIEDNEPDTIIITNQPDGISIDDGDTIIALNLDSLSFAWKGELPDGVLDGAAEVLAHPDDLTISGLDSDSNSAFYAGMVANIPSDDRLAIVTNDVVPLLTVTFPVLQSGRSVVVLTDASANVEDICASEGATLFVNAPTGRSL